MRGKKAKQLRRLAEMATRGEAGKSYQEKGGTVKLAPTCTRAVYQRMKKVHYSQSR